MSLIAWKRYCDKITKVVQLLVQSDVLTLREKCPNAKFFLASIYLDSD